MVTILIGYSITSTGVLALELVSESDSGSPEPGSLSIAGVAASSLRTAAHVLEPRTRLHRWPGRPRRWIPAQIECDDGTRWLLADLPYTLGWALWSGAVDTFTLYPETKRAQIERALDHFEAGRRDEGAPDDRSES